MAQAIQDAALHRLRILQRVIAVRALPSHSDRILRVRLVRLRSRGKLAQESICYFHRQCAVVGIAEYPAILAVNAIGDLRPDRGEFDVADCVLLDAGDRRDARHRACGPKHPIDVAGLNSHLAGIPRRCSGMHILSNGAVSARPVRLELAGITISALVSFAPAGTATAAVVVGPGLKNDILTMPLTPRSPMPKAITAPRMIGSGPDDFCCSKARRVRIS